MNNPVGTMKVLTKDINLLRDLLNRVRPREDLTLLPKFHCNLTCSCKDNLL